MKQLLLTLLLVVGITAVAGNDKGKKNDDTLVLQGYFMNNDQVHIEVYQGQELVLEKNPIFNYYKLKLEPGEYTIYFNDGNTTKKLYVNINGGYHVVIDVDFNLKFDAVIEDSGNAVNYRIISKKH